MPPSGSSSSRRSSAALVLTLLLLGGLVAVVAGGIWLRFRGSLQGQRFALPPISPTRLLNAKADVGYAGSQACFDCHAEETESYRRTMHSRAFSPADPSAQPAEAQLTHALSGRSYRVSARDGRLVHTEFVKTPDGQETTLAEFPLRFAMGSGSHARTYLIEDAGFLAESPLTWFATRQKWDLSPGYENQPHQLGFARTINTTCVHCHSGGVVPVGEKLYQMKIREHAIGCERCHGPGELHTTAQKQGTDNTRVSIANPRRLDRLQQEALCAQCHIDSATRIALRGRDGFNFRPGQRFTDHEVVYFLQEANREMRVTGHVEQMRLSKCYLQSDTLTCITCHHPHDPPAEGKRIEYFRKRCLSCHQEQACGLDVAERKRRNPQDNCAACHMPQSKTDIPHVAFTHHRIAIHPESPAEDPNLASAAEKRAPVKAGSLRPVYDLAHLPAIERKRCLGLAYIELGSVETNALVAQTYGQRGLKMLREVIQEGLRDPVIESTLARYHSGYQQHDDAIRHARNALATPEIPPAAKLDALDALGSALLGKEDYQEAEPVFVQLTQGRRSHEDWSALSTCRQRLKNLPGARAAAERAVKIAPHRRDLRANLALILDQMGESARAQEVIRVIQQLDQVLPP